ncbi:MAG: HD domain-containing protein [Syntrophales bacterium]|nr:HD domain-containing protein [Syntrophales bacterium]
MAIEKSFYPRFRYQGTALIADPIYSYIVFTIPSPEKKDEKTEQDIIDSPWLQRLRRIYQLQSARWVYPSAEHTRFQHSLGTMHLAGEFTKVLYPSLKEIHPDSPSANYVEELMRISGLLHDVGHGPYGHFFDEQFLSQYKLTHEDIGQEIIKKKLGFTIKAIRRSPSGYFDEDETLNPEHVAFLIKKETETEDKYNAPPWLKKLRQLFSGIYTVDNLDYVQRDAYMTGFSLDMVDIDRLKYYSFYTDEGLTLHQAGLSALRRFLNARLSLYTNVYFHRTTRAIDLHLKEIFRDTMNIIFPYHPIKHLGKYLHLDEWKLFSTVTNWYDETDQKKRKLGREWAKLYNRKVKWKMSYYTDISLDELQRGTRMAEAAEYEQLLRHYLPMHLKRIPLVIDMVTQDPRPVNPMAHSGKINVFDPSTGKISREPLIEMFKSIPARIIHLRIFSLNHNHDVEIAKAAERVLKTHPDTSNTNV